jgi:nucleotide-binding universal stress UspA family protein
MHRRSGIEPTRVAMKTILAAIDFSPVTTRVVAEAVALARGARARLVLLNVTTPNSLVRDYAALEALVEGAERKAGEDSTSHDLSAIQGDSLQIIGEPVDVILQQAARCSADYIVLGSHGHTALFETLVGGTTAGVIRGAACPVMLIPALKRKTQPGRKRPLWRRDPVAWLRRNEKRAARCEFKG